MKRIVITELCMGVFDVDHKSILRRQILTWLSYNKKDIPNDGSKK